MAREFTEEDIKRLQKSVVVWFLREGDDFPWRNLPERPVDPWLVAVGEVLLNRVSAERVLPVFKDIVTRYPSPCELSIAPPKDIAELIKPLGLQDKKAATLKAVSEVFCQLKNMEDTKKALSKVKGLGRNTYNAVLLFGFNEKRPLMDGVIGRVLGRVFGKMWKGKAVTDINAWKLSEELTKSLTVEEAKKFYYGILDVGRKVCKRSNPSCAMCPLRDFCRQAVELSERKVD